MIVSKVYCFNFSINRFLTIGRCYSYPFMFIVTVWQFGKVTDWTIRLTTHFCLPITKTEYNCDLVNYCTSTKVKIKIKFERFSFESISTQNWYLMSLIHTAKKIIVIFPLKWTGSRSFSFIAKFKRVRIFITTARTDRIGLIKFVKRVDGKNILEKVHYQ